MLLHNLKIAFRNMWKYRSQTAISIVGLAVGFTCFALSALWIRYEMTYDSFRPAADRTYVVNVKSLLSEWQTSRYTPTALAGKLQELFPEIENAANGLSRKINVEINGQKIDLNCLNADSSFIEMFDIKIIEGSKDFLIPYSKFVAITDEKAKQIFGNENPIGKTISFESYSVVLPNDNFTICAIVPSQPQKTNFRFDIILPVRSNHFYSTIIRLHKGIDLTAFRNKLYEHSIREDYWLEFKEMTVTQITEMRYKDNPYESEKTITFNHILIFSLSGLLVIICTLFNYLSLFVARFRVRRRELALRIVHGASDFSLFWLLATEFLISMAIALLLAFLIIESVFKDFQRLSEIKMNLSEISLEFLAYIIAVCALLMTVFAITTFILRRRALNVTIRGGRKNTFRKISVVVQLIISIGFTFCTVVIVKQMYYLHNTAELGFAMKNRASIEFAYIGGGETAFANRLSQIPEIEEVVKGGRTILPPMGMWSNILSDWEGKTEQEQKININEMPINKEIIDFWELKTVAGEAFTENDGFCIMINEAAAKYFGWDNPVGKWVGYKDRIVKGVLKNICNQPPTLPVSPTIYRYFSNERLRNRDGDTFSVCALVKYRAGTWKTVKQKINGILKSDFPDLPESEIFMLNPEETYKGYLAAEQSLLTLLGFTSLVCVLICIFGFVSLISLSCEERRKEIAIRKINGATVLDILNIFFKENFLLLIIGALVAFPIGYYVMRQWLEQYVRQTPIGAWVYLTIIAAMAAVIVMCVGWRVWRASVENPAEVIKKE